MLASEFVGMKVYGAGMQFAGKVKDLVIDPHQRLLTDFVVELDRDVAKTVYSKRLSIGKTKISVPISTIDKIGDAIVLKFSLDQLQNNVKKL